MSTPKTRNAEITAWLERGSKVVGSGTTGKSRLTGHTLRAFRELRSARDVRHAIGLSLADMAGRVNGATGRAYARQTIANYEAPTRPMYDTIFHGKRLKYKMPDDVIAVYRSALTEAVTLASAGAIDVRITISKRALWRIDPIMRCAICDHPFTVKRAGVTRCPWCIKHGQTRRKEHAKK